MKATKLLLVSLLAVLFISCSKTEMSYSLDKTRWISKISQGSDEAYALTFNGGYMQKFRLDPQTLKIVYLDYTAKYSLIGNKLIVYYEQNNGKITPVEGSYEEGIIYYGEYSYYLQ